MKRSVRATILGAAALLLGAGAAKPPETPVNGAVTVAIEGPGEACLEDVVDLIASTGGLDDPVAYSWSVVSGPGFIEPSASSARVRSLEIGEVAVRVVADGGASGSAEDTHWITFFHGDGIQKPNDFNGDGSFDISDPVALLEHIFGGGAGPLCADGSLTHPMTLALLDANASGEIDISDAVYVLGFLFQGGPTPLNCGGDVTCPCILTPGCDCPASPACTG